MQLCSGHDGADLGAPLLCSSARKRRRRLFYLHLQRSWSRWKDIKRGGKDFNVLLPATSSLLIHVVPPFSRAKGGSSSQDCDGWWPRGTRQRQDFLVGLFFACLGVYPFVKTLTCFLPNLCAIRRFSFNFVSAANKTSHFRVVKDGDRDTW